ncbi:MAG TPA: hypothetical protein VMR37_00500, partial [Rhabdochlamydiaceae bacterium]|nr:hypothetical protein [Rhabdochlamydiaceae bacterium]
MKRLIGLLLLTRWSKKRRRALARQGQIEAKRFEGEAHSRTMGDDGESIWQSRSKLFVSFLISGLVLAACSKTPPPPPALPYVTVVQSQVADVPLYYEYIGHVEPNQSARIKPQAQGIITGKYVTEGQEVQENDLLLTID